MRHILRLFFLFVVIIWSASPVSAETYRLVTAPFKPFADPTDPRGGFLVAITQEALALRGHKLEITYRPWARAMTEAAAGRFDGLLSAFYTEERGEKFYFSAPLNTTRMVFVGLREKVPFSIYKDFDQLQGYRIAIGRKWAYSEAFDSNKDLQKDIVNDEPSGIRLLFSERVDLFAVNQDQFLFHTSSMKEFNAEKTRILEPAISVNDQHIAAPKNIDGSLLFLSEFNTGLAALKASGRYEQIKNSFFLF